MTPEAAFAAELEFYLNDCRSAPLGVAVSGGGDSMALLVLAQDWGRRHGVAIRAATVDHGLRDGSMAEAAAVAAACAERGIPHRTLRWVDRPGGGNLQAAARAARYDLLAGWSDSAGIDCVLLGHTADDQAETVLMALARGSGVDGLAGMGRMRDGLFLRPLLSLRRAALRDLLRDKGVAWAEDPSNDDPQFDRVRARQMMGHLAELGLTTDRLIRTAGHMQRARSSLWQAAAEFAGRHVREDRGDLVFDADALALGRTDTEARVLAVALQWIGGGDYRPRYAALLDAAEAVLRGVARTLNGVRIVPEAGGARLLREAAATGPAITAKGGEAALIWDRRWLVSPTPATAATFAAGQVIRALGADLGQCPDWRDTGLPRASLVASPAIWHGKTLVSAPLAGYGDGYTLRNVADFRGFLLSH